MAIDYNHSRNSHAQTGPSAAIKFIFKGAVPKSIIDVGCGIGTWLKAAREIGVMDYVGVDGVDLPCGELLIPKQNFRCLNLTEEWDLGRRFDVALCLEVAEHLEPSNAEVLIATLVKHADKVIFSAACPGQPGQHHVNCRWPSYWQQLFNRSGYTCSDELRWAIWFDSEIDVWYRQNIFVAERNPSEAGTEKRIAPVIHPEFLSCFSECHDNFVDHIKRIEKGCMPFRWYLSSSLKACISKMRRVGKADK